MLEEDYDSIGSITTAVNGTIPTTMVLNTLNNYTGILFPQGNVHFQFNPTCEPAVFAAAFDNIDAGRVQLANTFFSIQEDDVLETSVGNSESLSASQLDALRGHIPDSFAELMNDCAKMCNIPTS